MADLVKHWRRWRFTFLRRLDISLLTLIAVALVTVAIFAFVHNAMVACLLLLLPIGLLGSYGGWGAGAIAGTVVTLLVMPDSDARNILISPPLDTNVWIMLGACYILFGALIGVQSATMRSARRKMDAQLETTLENARVSAERYETLVEEMNEGQEFLQRMNEELAILNMIATAVNSSLEVAQVLETAMMHIGALLNVDEVLIYWVSPAHDAFLLQAARPPTINIQAQPPLPLDEGLLGRVMQSQRAETLNEAALNLDQRPPQMGSLARCIIAVPLHIRTRLLGVLVLGRNSGRNFSVEDEKFLSSVGRVLAVAIENARLFMQAQEMSLADELTGLANRRMFNLQLAAELNQARISGARLCLMLFDLDFFKRINDRFGHLVGDEVLRAFAHAVQEELRDGDLFCRYGGEEFALIAPDISVTDAVSLATRIGHRIATNPFVLNDGTTHALTVSIGIACIGPGITTDEELIAVADQALYSAKAHGRNRVEIAYGNPVFSNTLGENRVQT